MTRKLAGLLFAVSMLGTRLHLVGADRPRENGPERSFEVTTTQRVPFLPGGTIRLDNSYGYLTVEGWDEPADKRITLEYTVRVPRDSRLVVHHAHPALPGKLRNQPVLTLLFWSIWALRQPCM